MERSISSAVSTCDKTSALSLSHVVTAVKRLALSDSVHNSTVVHLVAWTGYGSGLTRVSAMA